MDAQWRGLLDGIHETTLHAPSGRPLPAEIPQRVGRYPPAASASPQLRADSRRREADRRGDEGRRHAGRVPGIGMRFPGRQSGADPVSLPPAAAYGFRFHGAVRLRLIPAVGSLDFRRLVSRVRAEWRVASGPRTRPARHLSDRLNFGRVRNSDAWYEATAGGWHHAVCPRAAEAFRLRRPARLEPPGHLGFSSIPRPSGIGGRKTP